MRNNYLNKCGLRFSALFFLCLAVSSCGVKGDPMPPEKPIEIGRGHSNYGATLQKSDTKKTNLNKMKSMTEPSDVQEQDETEKEE